MSVFISGMSVHLCEEFGVETSVTTILANEATVVDGLAAASCFLAFAVSVTGGRWPMTYSVFCLLDMTDSCTIYLNWNDFTIDDASNATSFSGVISVLKIKNLFEFAHLQAGGATDLSMPRRNTCLHGEAFDLAGCCFWKFIFSDSKLPNPLVIGQAITCFLNFHP